MSSSDQATNVNSSTPFTVTRLRELLEGRLDGQNAGSLLGLVSRLSNVKVQPETQQTAGSSAQEDAGSSTSSRPTVAQPVAMQRTQFTVVQHALRNQRSARISSNESLPDQPSAAQLQQVSSLLHRNFMLHSEQLQLQIAQDRLSDFLQRNPSDNLSETRQQQLARLQTSLQEASEGVEKEKALLQAAEELFRVQHPELSLPAVTDPAVLQTATASQTGSHRDKSAADGEISGGTPDPQGQTSPVLDPAPIDPSSVPVTSQTVSATEILPETDSAESEVSLPERRTDTAIPLSEDGSAESGVLESGGDAGSGEASPTTGLAAERSEEGMPETPLFPQQQAAPPMAPTVVSSSTFGFLTSRVAPSLSRSEPMPQAMRIIPGMPDAATAAQARLTAMRASAAAAAQAVTAQPVTEPVRVVLREIDMRLNTQSVLPGSLQARNNLMLHLHNVMNRQLLPEIPSSIVETRSFFTLANLESGLSNISVVQMLTAMLRSSPDEEIRTQLDRILSSDLGDELPLARLLDRADPSYLRPQQALDMLGMEVAITRNIRVQRFVSSVLKLCQLALREMQLTQHDASRQTKTDVEPPSADHTPPRLGITPDPEGARLVTNLISETQAQGEPEDSTEEGNEFPPPQSEIDAATAAQNADLSVDESELPPPPDASELEIPDPQQEMEQPAPSSGPVGTAASSLLDDDLPVLDETQSLL
ncbi:MAG: hypothetical protein ACRC24_02330 [Vibrionaceae bacterium]